MLVYVDYRQMYAVHVGDEQIPWYAGKEKMNMIELSLGSSTRRSRNWKKKLRGKGKKLP